MSQRSPSTINRRKFVGTALFGLGASAALPLLAACGSAPVAPTPTTQSQAAGAPQAAPTSAPAATTNPGTQGAVPLTLSVRQAAEGTKTEAGIAAFQKQNPSITVKLETFASADYQTKLLSLGAGNTLPDVIYTNVGFYGLFANNGFLAALDPVIQQNKFDMSQYYKADLDYLQWKGKLYALPYKGHAGYSAIWYNDKMLADAKLDPAKLTDYDSLVAMAQKLTKDTKGTGKTDQWGWLNAGYEGWSLIGHFIAFGADEVTPSLGATKAQLDQPQQVAAITWLHDSLHKWKICPLPSEDYTKIFVSGAGAMQNGGLWMSGNQAAIGSRFTQVAVPMPTGPGGAISMWHNNDQMAMNAKTSHPDESWKLLTYMCGKEQGIVLGLSEGGGSATPGARRDVYTSDELKKAVPSIEWYAKQMEIAKPQWWAANLQTANVWSTIGQGLSKIMLNPNPPVAADFHQLNSLAQSVLDQPMP